MILLLTTLHESARSALNCGSEAAALNPKWKGGTCPSADGYRTQGAFGTTILVTTPVCRATRFLWVRGYEA
jgi:hypothetical protein